jgi:hypothetical protein
MTLPPRRWQETHGRTTRNGIPHQNHREPADSFSGSTAMATQHHEQQDGDQGDGEGTEKHEMKKHGGRGDAGCKPALHELRLGGTAVRCAHPKERDAERRRSWLARRLLLGRSRLECRWRQRATAMTAMQVSYLFRSGCTSNIARLLRRTT